MNKTGFIVVCKSDLVVEEEAACECRSGLAVRRAVEIQCSGVVTYLFSVGVS